LTFPAWYVHWHGSAEPGWHVAHSRPRPAVTWSEATRVARGHNSQPPDFDRCERARPPSAGPAHRLPRCMHPQADKPRRERWAHAPKRPTARPRASGRPEEMPCRRHRRSRRSCVAWRLGATRAGTHHMTAAPHDMRPPLRHRPNRPRCLERRRRGVLAPPTRLQASVYIKPDMP
jgi:hypothetical protein